MKTLRPFVGLLVLWLGVSADADAQVNFSSSNLPILVIEVDQQIVDEPKVPARMGLIDNGEGVRNNLSDPFNAYDGAIGIELRGSSSMGFPKKSYTVETRDDQGEDQDVELLGLPEEEDWVLHGPYSDKTLMRNVFIYELARHLGGYASRTRFVEVVINGGYEGVYVLMEKIKRDKNRVDISTLNDDEISGDDLTGGYILKIDKEAGAEVGGWRSDHPPHPGSSDRIFYQYHYPKPSDIVLEQEAYIQQVIATFENAMAGPQYADPEVGYPAYLDVPAAVDFFLLNELTKNVDAYRLSTFFYKDKDSKGGKLVLGPIWDFNIALGNANYYDGGLVQGFQVDYRVADGDFQFPFWWKKLWDEPAFNEAVRIRWNDLRQGTLHTDSLDQFIDETAAFLDEAQQRNFTRWPVLSQYVWPNVVVAGSSAGELTYLKNWIRERLAWMDTALPPVLPTATEPDPVGPAAFRFDGPYPNPFQSVARFTLTVAQAQPVTVEVYDILGRRVRRLHQGPMAGGRSYAFAVSATGLAGGLYLVRVAGLTFATTRRVLVVK